MPSDPPAFDPFAQFAEMQARFAEMQALWTGWSNPLRSAFGSLPRYETLDPLVQELALLALMHNMASGLQNPTAIKSVLSAEIAERAKRLAERG